MNGSAHTCRNYRMAGPRHGGFTFMEVIASIGMLAVLLVVAGQIVVQLKRQTVLAEQRALALGTLENAMEELTSLTWDDVNDDAIASFTLPAAVTERWPKAKLEGAVAASSEPVEAKRISLKLSLSPESRTHPVALTTWIYRRPRN